MILLYAKSHASWKCRFWIVWFCSLLEVRLICFLLNRKGYFWGQQIQLTLKKKGTTLKKRSIRNIFNEPWDAFSQPLASLIAFPLRWRTCFRVSEGFTSLVAIIGELAVWFLEDSIDSIIRDPAGSWFSRLCFLPSSDYLQNICK